MVDLLYCEFLKLKRSKMFLISILGGLVAPVMVFAGLIKARIQNPASAITYWDMFEQTNLYVLMLFGAIVYGVIAAYLFSREYTENTLKSVLTIPVSKTSFIIGKFLMLLIWMLILTAVAWGASLVLGMLGGAAEFSWFIITKALKQYFLGCFLLFLVMSPFVFITLWLKNLVPPVIAVSAVTLGNIALSNESLAVLFPWSSPYLIASQQIARYQYPLNMALIMILSTFLIGFVSSVIYFNKQDVK